MEKPKRQRKEQKKMTVSVFDGLEKYFRNDKEKLNEIVKVASEYFIYEDAGKLREELKRKDLTERNYYKTVAIFYFLFKVDLEYFELNQNPKLRDKLLALEVKRPFVDFFQIRDLGTSTRKYTLEYQREYTNKSLIFLSKVKYNFFVYDYLVRFNPLNTQERIIYDKVHTEIFDKIEAILKNSEKDGKLQINYARFLALPQELIRYDEDKRLTEAELTEKIIDHISLPLFKHIYNCLKYYSSLREEFDSTNNEIINHGFHMMYFSPRAYHFAFTGSMNSLIFNENKKETPYILTEKYRINSNGVYKPDILIIEECKGEIDDLGFMYEHAFTKMSNNKINLLKLKLEDIEKVLADDIKFFNMDKELKPKNLREQKAFYVSRYPKKHN